MVETTLSRNGHNQEVPGVAQKLDFDNHAQRRFTNLIISLSQKTQSENKIDSLKVVTFMKYCKCALKLRMQMDL